jgi:hypothetical protein
MYLHKKRKEIIEVSALGIELFLKFLEGIFEKNIGRASRFFFAAVSREKPHERNGDRHQDD